MSKLKPLDYKILYELMKNSKTSDRKLAKGLGVSQPTVTRRRARLEKEVIEGYTTIPKWDKFGYEIMAITLVKAPFKVAAPNKVSEAYEKSMKWLEKQSNVIFGGGCRGLGMTGLMISVHKSYSALDRFLTDHRTQLGSILENVETIIVNLSGKAVYRPFHLKYLAGSE